MRIGSSSSSSDKSEEKRFFVLLKHLSLTQELYISSSSPFFSLLTFSDVLVGWLVLAQVVVGFSPFSLVQYLLSVLL